MLEANKKHVPPKSYSLKIVIHSVNQINKKKVKARTKKKLRKPVAYKYAEQNWIPEDLKNRGLSPYNSLSHTDNRKYFSGLSLTRN